MPASNEYTSTTNYSLKKPIDGQAQDAWGLMINEDLDTLDTTLDTMQTDIDSKASASNPTFTGTISAPNDSISGDAIDGGTISNFRSTGIDDNLPSGGPAVTIDSSGNVTIQGTGALTLPSGTTAQRPITPSTGNTRYNSTIGSLEYYNGTRWIESTDIPFEVGYLVVAGGGAGGMGQTAGAAGGGAGGYRSSVRGELSGGGLGSEAPLLVNLSTNYTVTVGGGGTGTSSSGNNGGNGNPSTFASITSNGGGGGQGYVNIAGGTAPSGGSGGGGGAQNGLGGAGTIGQGYAGGNGAGGSDNYPAGGGGGAGGAGETQSTANTGKAGAGGAGVQSNIDGNNYYYAGGGGGGGYESGNGGGNGGIGGGGGGSTQTGSGGTGGGSARNAGEAGSAGASGTNAGDGGDNTGGGGGAGFSIHTGPSGAGGSGIVILRYPSSKSITNHTGASNTSGGLTSSTSTIGSNKVTVFTAGTGNIQFE